MRATSSRRRARQGKATFQGIGRGREERLAELRPGQVRCPVCRNGVTPTPSGHLRKHRDQFGHDCFNRRAA